MVKQADKPLSPIGDVMSRMKAQLSTMPKSSESPESGGLICPECGGFGFVEAGNDGIYRQHIPCKCQEQKRLSEIMDRRNVPGIFAASGFSDFKTDFYSAENEKAARIALETAKRYFERFEKIRMETFGKGLYFYSRTKGTGKTMLCAIMVNEFCRSGIRAKFFQMSELLSEIKAGYDPDAKESSAEIIRTVMDMPMLALDDIGVERQSAWVDETVYRIIDYRIGKSLPTIFSSNRTAYDLSYDERTVERIRKMSFEVDLPEESVRRKLSALEDLQMRKILGEMA